MAVLPWARKPPARTTRPAELLSQLLASQPAIYTTGGVHYATVGASAANVSWANVTLTSVTYAVLYDNTTTTKYAIAVYDFGGAQTVTANTFQINFTSAFPTNTLWYLSCN